MKVAIAGFGIEGKVNYAYWRQLGHDVTIVDERDMSPYDLPYGSKSILGSGAFKKLRDFDMVIRTAGLAPKKLKTKGKIWSATNEFFAKCPAPIIGVTGTKGKGTTASLIASILKEAGKTVHLVGNIGVPALQELPDIAPDDIVVYELSSFQLWDLEKSPHVAVVLMIEADHLDMHYGMKDYVSAKGNIRRFQKDEDLCFYHPENALSKQIARLCDRGISIRYGTRDSGAAYVEGNTFYIQQNAIGSVDALQVVGQHNIENACAAISAAYVYTEDTEAILRGLAAFDGLPHRLKFVRELDGVAYYDDSIATTPGSAVAAIHAIEQPKLLILGGHDKGGDYTELLELCRSTDTQVLAVGENRAKVMKQAKKAGAFAVESRATTMTEIVQEARAMARPDSAVILSPAAASFDMFKSYSDRGEQFVTAVGGLT